MRPVLVGQVAQEPTIPLGGSNVVLSLIFLVIALLCVAFFSSSEASLISVSKIRIRHLVERGNRAAKAVQRVVEQHEKLFATILLTENLFIVFASSIGTALAIQLLGPGGLLVATFGMTILIVIFGEITPKTLAAQHSERVALWAARPILWIIRLMTPITFLFTLVPRGISYLLRRGRPERTSPIVTEAELRMLIDIGEQEGTVEGAAREMLDAVFEFSERHANEVMIPRPDVIGIPQAATLADFRAIYAEAPHAGFPVYEESIDNIVGILNIKDVLLAEARNALGPADPLAPLVQPAHFVPESKRIGDLFAEMQAGGHQMAIVIDEFGGTAGLVTLKAIAAEIVGHLGDTPGADEEVHPIDEHTWDIDASLSIDDANDDLKLGLPDGDYETVAGFILDRLGHIPEPGEQLAYDGYTMEITSMDGVRIERVLVRRTKG